ncbi:hypothetical protein J4474_04205 [Candidatus Pacearchaeota archaeon]|nr:hypothetical protein [Candidatus Pacearchaeota archaeon]
MEFEIDVSGEDIFNKDYTICVANRDKIIKGFKFSESLISPLLSRYNQGMYKYSNSKKGKSDMKIRVYCVVIYHLFKSLNLSGEISLNICRDFTGREDDIRKSLTYFLEKELGLKLNGRIYFCTLTKESNAHHYSFLMRFDNKNQMKTYLKISLEDIEKFLKK